MMTEEELEVFINELLEGTKQLVTHKRFTTYVANKG